MWRFFCLFCFSKKSSFRNTWIICEFNETSANTLSKKKLGKLKKNCYNFFAVSFLCNQCFSFLTQNHQHLFCNDSMPSNFDLWLKKKNMTTKTIHFFFSLRIQLMFCQQFWDFVVWFWYLFVVFFSLGPSANWEIHLLFAQFWLCAHLSSFKIVVSFVYINTVIKNSAVHKYSLIRINDLIVSKFIWHLCTSIIEGSGCSADLYYHCERRQEHSLSQNIVSRSTNNNCKNKSFLFAN